MTISPNAGAHTPARQFLRSKFYAPWLHPPATHHLRKCTSRQTALKNSLTTDVFVRRGRAVRRRLSAIRRLPWLKCRTCRSEIRVVRPGLYWWPAGGAAGAAMDTVSARPLLDKASQARHAFTANGYYTEFQLLPRLLECVPVCVFLGRASRTSEVKHRSISKPS
jgi:hypothetical protein